MHFTCAFPNLNLGGGLSISSFREIHLRIKTCSCFGGAAAQRSIDTKTIFCSSW